MSEHVAPPRTAEIPTPIQRERATTIFERTVEGRRAAALPPCDVPETPLSELIPARFLRERPAALRPCIHVASWALLLLHDVVDRAGGGAHARADERALAGAVPRAGSNRRA